MTTPRTTLCIGCGRDHGSARGCGYDRELRWTSYTRRESLAYVRFFPVIVGLAAASVALFFIIRPPDNPIFLYVGVGLPLVVAILFGGFGTKSMVEELRKRRYRVISTDGRDRALVVFVGDGLHYAFGESLKYEPVVAELDYLRPLSSAAALALADELGELMDEGLATWLRRDSDDETLLRDATAPDARLALVVAMTILGLAGRERIALFVGRYKAWGRGGKKMPETTRGFEVALDTRPDQDSDEPPLETQVLALAQPGDESPIALDALIDTITEDRGAERFLATLDVEGEPDLDAAREAWRRVQKDETELVMRLIQHVLPDRPRTIGVTESAE